MDKIIAYGLPGLFTGAAYAIAASGLVLTYTTTRVFNIAHGAFGMLMAFIFWDFSQRQGLPIWLSLILVLGIVAPAIGWFVHRFIARGLADSPVGVSLVVTVGLFVGLIGVAQQIYPPESRTLPPFFPETSFEIAGTFITAHQIITILASIAVAGGLYALLNRTRIGTAMRASVDNPELLKLFGGNPEVVGALSWAIGISLAALGGILLASTVGLDYYALTLLVINAYAAAMVGRLRSLPLTFAGAMGLGLITAYSLGFIPPESALTKIVPVIPALFLFGVIILLPTAQLRIGQVKGIVSAPLPSLPQTLGWGGGLVLFVAALAGGLADDKLLLVGTAATYAMVILSLVLLTGYGGHVSLAQLTFAGVGALTYSKLDQPNLLGLLISAVVAGIVGGLVALPVLRLTGLYLALSTLAFAVIMDKLVFQADFAFGFGGLLEAKRLSILGQTINSTRTYVVVMTIFFVLASMAVLALRRGVLGRMLIALRDSPAACGTLGLDARWFRVGLFGLSASIAGLAGALFAGLRQGVGAADFQYFNSLPLLLLAVVFGVTSVTGATLGGIGLMLLPVLQAKEVAGIPLGGVMFIIIGVGAVFAGRDPNGLANLLFKFGHVLGRRVGPLMGGRIPALPGLPRRTVVTVTAEESPVDEKNGVLVGANAGAPPTTPDAGGPTTVGEVRSDGAPRS